MRQRICFDPASRAEVETPGFLPTLEDCAGNPMMCALSESIRRIYLEYGLGYRDTTYRGLVLADLQMKDIPIKLNPGADVASKGYALGEASLNCIKIGDQGAVIILALHDSIRAADRAIMQTYIRLLAVPVGIIVNFGKKQLDVKVVHSLRKE